jgi:hypothetical protein
MVLPVFSSTTSTLNEVALPSLSQEHEAPLAGHIGSVVARFTVVCGARSKYRATTKPISMTTVNMDSINILCFFFIRLLT